MRFEWNQTKAARNVHKHGVSFEEAVSVFYDELAIQFYDEGSLGSSEEEHYLLLGQSHKLRLLLVSHRERSNGDVIRIIFARKATRKEAERYPKPQ